MDRRPRRSHLIDNAQMKRLSYRAYLNQIMWMTQTHVQSSLLRHRDSFSEACITAFFSSPLDHSILLLVPSTINSDDSTHWVGLASFIDSLLIAAQRSCIHSGSLRPLLLLHSIVHTLRPHLRTILSLIISISISMHSFAFSDEPLNYTPVYAHSRPTSWTSLLLVHCLGKSDDVSCVIILSSTSSPLVTLTLGTLLFTLRAILTWIHTFLQLYPFSGQSLLRITWCFFVTSSEWLVSSILRFLTTLKRLPINCSLPAWTFRHIHVVHLGLVCCRTLPGLLDQLTEHPVKPLAALWSTSRGCRCPLCRCSGSGSFSSRVEELWERWRSNPSLPWGGGWHTVTQVCTWVEQGCHGLWSFLHAVSDLTDCRSSCVIKKNDLRVGKTELLLSGFVDDIIIDGRKHNLETHVENIDEFRSSGETHVVS